MAVDHIVWKEVWADEFTGSFLDESKWSREFGNGKKGWGNHELQTYCWRNTELKGGRLRITAEKEHSEGCFLYTSGRIHTRSKFEFKYGFVEAKIRFPLGKGLWPTFWLMGDTNGSPWPICGEMDILDTIGHDPETYFVRQEGEQAARPMLHAVHSVLHSPESHHGSGNICSTGVDPNRFNLYAVEWDRDYVRWYVNGKVIGAVFREDIGAAWVFDHEFYIILNLAVGGDWPGSPDDDTVFPAAMEVEYVRVYKNRKELTPIF